MLVVLFRSFILYVLVFFVIRLMGKRELAQMQPFELLIIVMVADLASSPLSSNTMPMINGVASIITVLLVYIVFTLLIQSSNVIQKIVCGKPTLLIENGTIVESELRKQQYTVEELMSQIRSKDIYKVADVAYAILETSGDLNVIPKDENTKQFPFLVVADGNICKDNLEVLRITEEHIYNILNSKNLNVNDILIGTIDEDNQFIYQMKEKKYRE